MKENLTSFPTNQSRSVKPIGTVTAKESLLNGTSNVNMHDCEELQGMIFAGREICVREKYRKDRGNAAILPCQPFLRLDSERLN